MIALLLLFLTLLLSEICGRIGAIALEMTGMPEEQAQFQALSAFSGVGFTTKEAEFAIGHPQRRKIIETLIKLGSAGVITTLLTLGGTVLSTKSIIASLSRDPKYSWMPVNAEVMGLIAAAVLFYAIARSLRHPGIARLVKEIISAILLKTKIVKPVSFQEVLVNANGYGIFQVEISDRNPLAGKTVRDVHLDEKEIHLLYVNRLSDSISPPPPSFQFAVGDVAAFYGPVAAVHDYCADLREEIPEEKTEGTLRPGVPAPDFSLEDQNGRKISLSDFKGKRSLVIVFYPKDKSFFCTTQLKTLSDHLSEIRSLGAEVIAINQESAKSHAGFCDSSNLKFSLLSDPKKQACKAYNAMMFRGLLVDRTVYIIDKHGTVQYAERGKPALTEILAVLRQIQ